MGRRDAGDRKIPQKEQKGFDFVSYFCYQFRKSKIAPGVPRHGNRQPYSCNC